MATYIYYSIENLSAEEARSLELREAFLREVLLLKKDHLSAPRTLINLSADEVVFRIEKTRQDNEPNAQPDVSSPAVKGNKI